MFSLCCFIYSPMAFSAPLHTILSNKNSWGHKKTCAKCNPTRTLGIVKIPSVLQVVIILDVRTQQTCGITLGWDPGEVSEFKIWSQQWLFECLFSDWEVWGLAKWQTTWLFKGIMFLIKGAVVLQCPQWRLEAFRTLVFEHSAAGQPAPDGVAGDSACTDLGGLTGRNAGLGWEGHGSSTCYLLGSVWALYC